jgi:hypothetical protein
VNRDRQNGIRAGIALTAWVVAIVGVALAERL